MAYESSISFAAIKDFRNAEINGIPALFTMCRIDSETLPTGFHSCEVMGGRGSDFQWLWQTSPERSSPGSLCSGKGRHTPKYAGTVSTTR